jgi:hypothetical protein
MEDVMQRIASSLLLTALVLTACGCAVLNIFGMSRTIHGVVERDGRPVAGARVIIAGRNAVVTTKEDGGYEYCCVVDSVLIHNSRWRNRAHQLSDCRTSMTR